MGVQTFAPDFRSDGGASQGQNLAVTGLCVPSTLDSGQPHPMRVKRAHTSQILSPAVGLCLWPYGCPRWGALSYARGTGVPRS